MQRCVLLLFFVVAVHTTFEAQWVSKGIGGGGAVFAISVSPHDGDELFLACDMSDVFHSTDFGSSWETISYQQLIGFHHTVVRFTDNPQILYTLKNNSSGYIPVKSSDGGATWGTITNPAGAGSFLKCYELFAHPQRNDLIIVSDMFNVHISHNGGASYGAPLYTDNTPKGMHLAGVFFDDATIYIATNKRLLISTDTGHTFSTLAIGGIDTLQEEITWFEGAKQAGVTKLYCTTLSPGVVAPKVEGNDIGSFKNVYRMNVGDTAWTTIKNNLPEPSVDKAYHIAVLPADTSIVYLSGSTVVAVNGSHTVRTVFKSTNGGDSFSNVFLDDPVILNNGNTATGWLGWGGSQHTWWSVTFPGGLAVDPNDPNRVLLTDGSAVHRTTNGGATWQQAYLEQTDEHLPGQLINDADEYATNGLETTVCYWLTWVDSLNMLASFADLLLERSSDGGNKWSYNYSGLFIPKINDISIILKHPQSNYYYAATGDVVGSNGDYTDGRVKQLIGRISYTTDNGQTWQVLHDFHKTVSWIALDPRNPNRMYATLMDTLDGIGGAYVCDDITNPAATWDTLSQPVRTQGRARSIFPLNDGSLVLTYDSRDSATFDFTQSAGVFYSADSGATWQDKSVMGMFYNVSSLEIDPNDSTQNTWLVSVTTNATNQPGVYRTTNRGDDWTRIFTQGAISCTFHPIAPNEMYLCTENKGLYYVTGIDSSTPNFIQDNSFPFRRPQRVFFNPYKLNEVWVMTFGNGMRVGASAHTLYSISTSAGSGGMISPAGVRMIPENSNQLFTFLPDSGYVVDSVFIDGIFVGDSASYTFTGVNSTHTIYVTFVQPLGQVTVNVALQNNWNIVSIPVIAADYRKTTLFPDAVSNAFSFQGGYQPDDTLQNNLGYWIKSDSSRAVPFVGYPRATDTINVVSGWNLIGTLSSPLAVNQVTSIPPGISASSFYGYSNGYTVSDTLFPGFGYWVKVDQDAQLILTTGSVLQSAIIRILSSNELPPSPPEGANFNTTILPDEFTLSQNYPNPFNPVTQIRFEIANPRHVTLNVYNILGEEVATLVNEIKEPGRYSAQWDASTLPSGVYYYRLIAGNFVQVKTMMLLR